MTWPVPMTVEKGPRPMEESNLAAGYSQLRGPGSLWHCATATVLRQRNSNHILLALVVGLGGVLEIAGVLDGDLLASLGEGAGALLENGFGDTHCDGGVGEEALGGGRETCEGSGCGGSKGIGQGKHVEGEM